ncbi:MAG: DUF2716 domain-containing protein [Flavobacterium sp.]
MKNWQRLSQEEEKNLWEIFFQQFNFNPSINEFPGVKTSLPQKKFSIGKYLSGQLNYDKLEDLALVLFQSITIHGERLYALDWQHQCYSFDPRQEIDRNQFGEWVIPILPNGDYYIFLTKNFQNVWFGHPWEETITLIGYDLVKEIENRKITI